MRLLGLVAIVSTLALASASAASSYGWPIKPFNKQHPIRGFFGDPRTVYENGVLAGGFDGPGFFSFHQGVDISAPNGTPIYPVVSGIAHYLGAATLNVDAGKYQGNERIFQYFHIVPIVGEGQAVIAEHTVIGYVQAPFGHVHLTEINGSSAVNPLQKGHLAPYVDHTRPTIRDALIRNQTGLLQTPLGLCGRVEIAVDAFDTPPMRVPGSFGGLPVAPALVRWSITTAERHRGGSRGAPPPTSARRCRGTGTSSTSTRKAPTRTRRASAPSSTARCPAAISSCSRGTSTRTRFRTPSTRSGSTRPTSAETGRSSTSGSPF